MNYRSMMHSMLQAATCVLLLVGSVSFVGCGGSEPSKNTPVPDVQPAPNAAPGNADLPKRTIPQ